MDLLFAGLLLAMAIGCGLGVTNLVTLVTVVIWGANAIRGAEANDPHMVLVSLFAIGLTLLARLALWWGWGVGR